MIEPWHIVAYVAIGFLWGAIVGFMLGLRRNPTKGATHD